MRAEEQLFAYKELRKNGQAFFIDNYEDADRIIESLEKQIPKVAIKTIEYPQCPSCKKVFYWGCIDKYCNECGQALKWDD